jgi:hypothetical protein
MLCPRWELPLARRGTLALSACEMNAIFESAEREKWEIHRKTRVTRMNVPFSLGNSPNFNAELFGVEK